MGCASHFRGTSGWNNTPRSISWGVEGPGSASFIFTGLIWIHFRTGNGTALLIFLKGLVQEKPLPSLWMLATDLQSAMWCLWWWDLLDMNRRSKFILILFRLPQVSMTYDLQLPNLVVWASSLILSYPRWRYRLLGPLRAPNPNPLGRRADLVFCCILATTRSISP